MQSMLTVNVNVFTAGPSAQQLQASPLDKTTKSHKRLGCSSCRGFLLPERQSEGGICVRLCFARLQHVCMHCCTVRGHLVHTLCRRARLKIRWQKIVAEKHGTM